MNASSHDTLARSNRVTELLLDVWPRAEVPSTSEIARIHRAAMRNVQAECLLAFFGSLLQDYADQAKFTPEQRELLISWVYRALWEDFDDDGYHFSNPKDF